MTTPVNSYATLASFKNYIVNRSTTADHVTTTDTVDDGVIEQLLESASRYIENKTNRRFYPRVETRYFDTPDSRELLLDDDLLAVISITNGDGNSLPSTEYNLIDKNRTPYYGIKIKRSSTYSWEYDTEDGGELVISISGFWGFHNLYTMQGWKVGSTLAEDLDASELPWDVVSGTPFVSGQIIKVDNEIAIVDSVSNNTITTLTRPQNGSTAATHSSGATVYIWQPMDDLRNAVIEMVNNAYHRRFGESLRGEETVTAAGVVITPRDVPRLAKEFIESFARKL